MEKLQEGGMCELFAYLPKSAVYSNSSDTNELSEIVRSLFNSKCLWGIISLYHPLGQFLKQIILCLQLRGSVILSRMPSFL